MEYILKSDLMFKSLENSTIIKIKLDQTNTVFTTKEHEQVRAMHCILILNKEAVARGC